MTSGPHCPNCSGRLMREPASARCVACGCRWEVTGATEDQKLAQRVLDRERRPRSVECQAEYQDLVASPPPRPRTGWVQLPDPTRGTRRPPPRGRRAERR